ncbi:hypothetical protein A1O3_06339 [Capronia epimyces CBS 606.96]|uniref:Glutamyl-tRNA amidotransferase complex subunit Gta3 domain-containing protein n=1 Tax=Capronia epimyces CBS 606.96 TaxID=1182542 RepID=W9XZX6_9EURO|nr:uncharacterized protein A1O3_06339 [Capronia epimyces CBS 606.96]EXJ82526.1 hypothetical protein A1O3_06339 [Capronia epimyces CBS 606.96]
MPRISRIPFTIRTELSGPVTSPDRDKILRLVKSIEIDPKITSLLKTPTWSVSSLLPPPPSVVQSTDIEPDRKKYDAESEIKPDLKKQEESESEVTPSKLHHLLRLSALPPPKSVQEQTDMLRTLQQQLHFVKEIQKVDTTGVKPLVALRDETRDAREERAFTLESLQEYLSLEEKVGVNGTIRRRKVPVDWSKEIPTRTAEKLPRQDDRIVAPFEMGEGYASRKRGQFFFVKRSKKTEDSAAG